MDRREFFKGAVSASLAVGLAALLPKVQTSAASPQANATSSRFRGSSDGRIYELSADGMIWQLRANFGAHCAIPEVHERGGKVYARLVVRGHGFTIESLDGRRWRTAAGGASQA
jgi:hypothetical protein